MTRDLFGDVIEERPSVPFIRGSDTSREAAESMVPFVSAERLRVLRAIAKAGGATAEEAGHALDKPHYTVSPRAIELRRMGLIEKTEQVRQTSSGRNAAVYVVTDEGRRFLERKL